MNTVNPCDAQDEREAAGLAAPVPNIDVEKLRGLSKMIAERAVTALEKEIAEKTKRFFELFRGDSHERKVVIDTSKNFYMSVTPHPREPGKFLIEIDARDLAPLLKDKAVHLARSDVIGAALKDFLERADSLVDDVQQLRDQVQS